MKDKLQTFFFGVSVGLLAGCLFFIFKLDNYFRKIDFTLSGLTKSTPEEGIYTQKDSSNKTKTTTSVNNEKQKKPPLVHDNGNDKPYTNFEQQVNHDTPNEKYEVLTDEVTGVATIAVTHEAPSKHTTPEDSMVAEMAGVVTPEENASYLVEFRKSPLNSKGYIMTRSRVIVYGFRQGNDLMMIRRKDDFLVRNNGQFFKISFTPEFKPIEFASESEIPLAFSNNNELGITPHKTK